MFSNVYQDSYKGKINVALRQCGIFFDHAKDNKDYIKQNLINQSKSVLEQCRKILRNTQATEEDKEFFFEVSLRLQTTWKNSNNEINSGCVDNCSTTRTTPTCRSHDLFAGLSAASMDPEDKSMDVEIGMNCEHTLESLSDLIREISLQVWKDLRIKLLALAYAYLINDVEKNFSIWSHVALTLKEKKLLNQSMEIVKQVKTIAGDQPEQLNPDDLKDLLKVLRCTQKTWDKRKNKKLSMEHAKELGHLSQYVSGKASPSWEKLGLSLLKFACIALIVVGVLAAIPSGSSSLLFTAIGLTGLSAIAGAGALSYGRETGLAKSVSQLKENLDDFRNNEESYEGDVSPSYIPIT